MQRPSELVPWLIVWVAVIIIIVFVRWRRKVAGAGLVFAYLMSLSLSHCFGAAVYSFPWYDYRLNYLFYSHPRFDLRWVENGFRLSAYGIIAFGVGCLILAPIFIHFFHHQKKSIKYLPDPRLPTAYIFTGFLFYFVLLPLLHRIPSLSAPLGGGLSLMATGIGLGLWHAWQLGNKRKFKRWLILSLASLPLFTLVGHGFMSFGSSALFAVLAFVASFYRPRWKVVIVGLLSIYVGLSFFVTYMRDRSEIREVVWGGESISRRVERVFKTIRTTEPFNIYDQDQLWRIDWRLNQNKFVGAAVDWLSDKREFAHGKTLIDSLVVLIPRVIWHEKATKAGGSELLTRYTGIRIAGGTTWEMGNVMEFYVNFGVVGVIGGFLCLGVLVTVFDNFARECLLQGDWLRFTFWFLPGLSLMQVENNLIEITSTMGASIALVFFVSRLLRRFGGRRFSAKVESPA